MPWTTKSRARLILRYVPAALLAYVKKIFFFAMNSIPFPCLVYM
jgi:hypothetical protein